MRNLPWWPRDPRLVSTHWAFSCPLSLVSTQWAFSCPLSLGTAIPCALGTWPKWAGAASRHPSCTCWLHSETPWEDRWQPQSPAVGFSFWVDTRHGLVGLWASKASGCARAGSAYTPAGPVAQVSSESHEPCAEYPLRDPVPCPCWLRKRAHTRAGHPPSSGLGGLGVERCGPRPGKGARLGGTGADFRA